LPSSTLPQVMNLSRLLLVLVQVLLDVARDQV